MSIGKKFFSVFILLGLFFGPVGGTEVTYAQDSAASGGVPGLVKNLFVIGAVIIGVTILGAFVYAGYLLMFAAANASTKEEGKKWMTNATLGAITFFAAILILRTINPDLLELRFPSIKIDVSTSEESNIGTRDQFGDGDICAEGVNENCGKENTCYNGKCTWIYMGKGSEGNIWQCNCSAIGTKTDFPEGEVCSTDVNPHCGKHGACNSGQCNWVSLGTGNEGEIFQCSCDPAPIGTRTEFGDGDVCTTDVNEYCGKDGACGAGATCDWVYLGKGSGGFLNIIGSPDIFQCVCTTGGSSGSF